MGIYTQPFDNYTQIVIPGSVHGFHDLTPDAIRCQLGSPPSLYVKPDHVAIDPLTQEVTITFAVSQSGRVLVRSPSLGPWPF